MREADVKAIMEVLPKLADGKPAWPGRVVYGAVDGAVVPFEVNPFHRWAPESVATAYSEAGCAEALSSELYSTKMLGQLIDVVVPKGSTYILKVDEKYGTVDVRGDLGQEVGADVSVETLIIHPTGRAARPITVASEDVRYIRYGENRCDDEDS